MDYRAFVLAALGVVLAYSAWNANESGEISVKYSRVLRSQQPIMFKVVLVLRLVLAAGAFVAAGAAGLGWS